MANANENPELEVGFCTDGTVIDIPESLRLLGVTPENPTIYGHVINKLFKMIFENLNHQKKKAISFWEPDEYYVATANNIDICRKNNKIYFCKQTHNDTGDAPKDPATNPDYWTVLYDLDKPLESTYALINHNHDTTYAKLLGDITKNFSVKVGISANHAVNLSQIVEKNKNFNGDVNTLKNNGFYQIDISSTNIPETTYGTLVITGKSDDLVTQIFTCSNTANSYIRIGNATNTWTSWKRLDTSFDNGNLLTGSGYQKFSNGLIIQWGYVQNNGNYSFPLVFPNSCFSLTFGRVTANEGTPGADSVTASGFYYRSLNIANTIARYIAIGY